MRRLPPWIWLLMAGVFGITASLAWLKSQPAGTAPKTEPAVFLLAAKRDIAPATRLSADQVQSTQWHQEHLPKGAFSNLTELEGRVTAYPMVEGELILEKKLAPKGTVPGLTALLPVNRRAMTVKVDEASGVAGFVSPDNRVDVVVTIGKGEHNNEPLSRVLLQNLRVLGTGQRIENRPGDKPQVVPTVTLEVAPEEGERLALAAQEGRISLVLRGQQDDRVLPTLGVNAANLFGAPAIIPKTEAAPKQIAPPRRTAEVIRGLERAPVNF
jgi:pilus assembly protein CpaB